MKLLQPEGCSLVVQAAGGGAKTLIEAPQSSLAGLSFFGSNPDANCQNDHTKPVAQRFVDLVPDYHRASMIMPDEQGLTPKRIGQLHLIYTKNDYPEFLSWLRCGLEDLFIYKES